MCVIADSLLILSTFVDRSVASALALKLFPRWKFECDEEKKSLRESAGFKCRGLALKFADADGCQ